MARVLTEARQALLGLGDWERDQKAWNLPRAPGAALARGADKAGDGGGEGELAERGSDPAIAPETAV